MQDWRQDSKAEFTFEMRRIARQTTFNCKKCVTAECDGFLQEPAIGLAEISEFGLVEPSTQRLTFGRGSLGCEADL